MYIEVNGLCTMEYRSRKASCYRVMLLVICCSTQVGTMYCVHTHGYRVNYTCLPCSAVD